MLMVLVLESHLVLAAKLSARDESIALKIIPFVFSLSILLSAFLFARGLLYLVLNAVIFIVDFRGHGLIFTEGVRIVIINVAVSRIFEGNFGLCEVAS